MSRSRDPKQGQRRLIACFCADLLREGKFYHATRSAAVSAIGAPTAAATPVSAIVANYARRKPSLLRHGPHSETETLWHEFGHILHESLTKADSARFSGAETERDFVEAPSQIMQHWV
jgi:Zn-dependent oligopeptidase